MQHTITEESISEYINKLNALKSEIGKIIVGQTVIVDQLIVCLIAGGHALLEGVPGLAKTLLVRTLAQSIDVDFKRIQFTPDLMPTDIIGTEILEEDQSTGKRFFKFEKGPLFTHILLADEINRTPPKTQSALLEAMQEYQVTSSGVKRMLAQPFFVLATQNPIEQAGTYPLPEAQLDRFLLYLSIDYPTEQEEFDILKLTTGEPLSQPVPVLTADDILEIQKLVRKVFISDDLIAYVNAIVRASRPGNSPVNLVNTMVRWGAGPRAGQALILTAKASALLNGRYSVTPEDIKSLCYAVMRHRMLLTYKAESDRITHQDITNMVLNTIKPEPSRIG